MGPASLIRSARRRLEELCGELDRLPAARALPLAREELHGLVNDLTTCEGALADQETTLRFLRLIVTAGSLDQMVQGAARFLQEWAQVEAVGVRLRVGDDFPYFTTLGLPDGFVQAESRLVAVDHHGHRVRDADGRLVLECMCGVVIGGCTDSTRSFFTDNGSFWTNSTTQLLHATSDDELGKTRNHCNREGYESVALIPLRNGSETFGLVQLNDRRRDRYTPDRIRLLEELASYVAAALD